MIFSILLLTTIITPISRSTPIPPNDTIVLKHHGVLLKPGGLIALEANENLISLFSRIKIPKVEQITNCKCSWIEGINTQLIEQTLYYTKLFQSIAHPFSTKDVEKRFLAAIGLGLGITDLLLTGISYTALNTHVKAVQSKLNHFISAQHTFDIKIIQIEDDIIHKLDHLESELNEDLKIIQCQILNTSGKLFSMQLLNDWNEKLKLIFRPILLGEIMTQLTPDLLSPSDLAFILGKHSTLSHTYFAKNPFSLYKTSKLTIAHAYLDINQRSVVIHNVMTFPMAEENKIFPFFQIVQTGIVKNSLCFQLDLPNFVYSNGKEFFPLDEANCQLSSAIATCFLPLLKENNKCLTSLNCTHKLKPTICKTSFAYDTSGILITSQDKITNFQDTDHNKAIKSVRVSQFNTAFLSWNSTSMVQIGDIFVQKPSSISTFLIPSYLTDDLKRWESLVNVTALRLLQLNTSSLHDRVNSLESTIQNAVTNQKPRHISIIGITLMVTALILVVFVLVIYKFKNVLLDFHSKTSSNTIGSPACAPLTEQPEVSISIIN